MDRQEIKKRILPVLKWMGVVTAILVLIIIIPLIKGFYDMKQQQKACDNGVMSSCVELAFKHHDGDDLFVEKDFSKAFQLFQIACDGGDGFGCVKLGEMYDEENGQVGFEKDYFKAMQLYQKGCDYGNDSGLGCSIIDKMYFHSIQMEKRLRDTEASKKRGMRDDFKMAELYQKKCQDGDVRGCASLGYMYMNGMGVKQDYLKAIGLYQKACDSGNIVGCNNLGYVYENGEGVQQDFTKALESYGKACDMKDNLGCEYYADLKQKI